MRLIKVELCGASRGGKGKARAFHPLPASCCSFTPLSQKQGSILLLCLRYVSLPAAAWRKTIVDTPVCRKQGSMLQLCLGDVSLPDAAWRKMTVLGSVVSPPIVVAGVIPGCHALVGSASLAPRPLLLTATWTPAIILGGAGRAGSFLLPIKGAPLLHRVQ